MPKESAPDLEEHDPAPVGTVAITARVVLRRHLSVPYLTPAFAAGLYTTAWVKRIEARASWAARLEVY